MFSISIMGQKQKYLEKEASIEKLKGNIKAISFYEQYYKDNKLVLDQFCGKMNYNNRLLAGLTYCNYKGEITGYSKLFYDANSKLIEKIRIKTLGEIESITKYKYDQKGFIKEELIYEYDKLSIRIKYNSSGNIEYVADYDDKGSESSKLFYKYNDNSKLIERSLYLDGVFERKFFYRRDSKGNCVQVLLYDSNNEYLGGNSNKYDEKGRLVETYNESKCIVDQEDSDVKEFVKSVNTGFRTYYYYDEYDNLVREEDDYFVNSPERCTDYVYNKKGLIIEIVTFQKLDDIISDRSSVKYSYEFDSHGNWVKMIGTSDDSNAVEIQVRKIEYYD